MSKTSLPMPNSVDPNQTDQDLQCLPNYHCPSNLGQLHNICRGSSGKRESNRAQRTVFVIL